jgi:hypothetical protein
MQIRRGVKSAMILGALGAGVSSLLTGCASVTAIPLEPDGLAAVPGAQTGFRYFLPRPYLLVAEAPAAKTGGGSNAPSSQTNKPSCFIPGQPGNVDCKVAADHKAAADAAAAEKKDAAAAAAAAEKGDAAAAAAAAAAEKKDAKAAADAAEKEKEDAAAAAENKGRVGTAPKSPAPAAPPGGTDGSDSKAASAPATDTSFQVGDGKTYIAKLIYLPDYSRPMAVELNTGLVGISKADLQLQDGWMLTSVSANADNSKMGDVLTAAIQALSTSSTGGATKAASKAATGAVGSAAPTKGKVEAPRNPALRPGLYAFDYSYGMSRVSAICAVSFFDSNGITTPATGQGACGPDYSRPMLPPVSALY